jgi:N-acetylglucosamine-6-sulfatase
VLADLKIQSSQKVTMSSIFVRAMTVALTMATALARPNFVFVITDDQDVHMNSLEYMPEVQEHLIAKGTTFDKHYCTGMLISIQDMYLRLTRARAVAICCPSRVNLWTGQMSHNTNVTNVQPPWGRSASH